MVSGFEADKYVEVNCDGDKITLTKTTPPEIWTATCQVDTSNLKNK